MAVSFQTKCFSLPENIFIIYISLFNYLVVITACVWWVILLLLFGSYILEYNVYILVARENTLSNSWNFMSSNSGQLCECWVAVVVVVVVVVRFFHILEFNVWTKCPSSCRFSLFCFLFWFLIFFLFSLSRFDPIWCVKASLIPNLIIKKQTHSKHKDYPSSCYIWILYPLLYRDIICVVNGGRCILLEL